MVKLTKEAVLAKFRPVPVLDKIDPVLLLVILPTIATAEDTPEPAPLDSIVPLLIKLPPKEPADKFKPVPDAE